VPRRAAAPRSMISGDRFQNALSASENFKQRRLEQIRELKRDWHDWLYKNPPNMPLFLSNLVYLALSLTTLILTVLIMHEHADDFQRNHLSRFRDPNNPDAASPKPCGMPTPDGMYLLQALGALPGAGWDGATLEPNYQTWMQKIDRSLCSKVVQGVEMPTQTADCTGNPDYGTDLAEELLTIGFLMDDKDIMPTESDINDQTALNAKAALFDTKACITDHNKADDDEPFYSTQQFDSYGDLKGRVARAYLTAMPAFSRYKKEREACQVTNNGHEDPFDTNCKHACHIKRELDAAAADQFAMYRTDHPIETTTLKQLYRLVALSLAGYYDRYHNSGECFKNGGGGQDQMSAIDFCAEAMDSNPGVAAEQGKTQQEAVLLFTAANEGVKNSGQCLDTSHSPTPPAPPVLRAEVEALSTNDRVGPAVCAATLEYGLVEQGRLFGIPDVIMPFVVDNRVHRSFHFIAWIIYTALYLDPEKDGGMTFSDPKAKLELYIAYRLASSSIWAIIVANVAGFMMVRALVPMGVQLMKIAGIMSARKRRPVINGVPTEIDEFEPIRLRRPQAGWFVWLTIFVTLLVVYWIMWLDPATQSHYYITTTCEDWAGLGVHVPSGAYVTTWGKRRYERFGEHLIGILLIITVFVFLFQYFIGRSLVDKTIVEDTSQIKLGAVSRKKFVAVAMLIFALLIQLFFIIQSGVSGGKWFDGAKGDDLAKSLGNVYAKDVLMSVWAAFWNAAAIAWYRQKWAISDLKRIFQIGWMATSVLLVWMPVLQASILLDREIEVAFKNGKGSKDTERLAFFICILGFSFIWTCLLVFRLREVWLAMPKTNSANLTSEAIEDAQEEAIEQIAQVEEAEGDASGGFDLFDGQASKPRFKFDLSGVRVGPARTGARVAPVTRGSARVSFALSGSARGERKSVYMPLMPKL